MIYVKPGSDQDARLQSALDTLTEGLLVIDRRQNIVLANEAFARLLGSTPDKLLGQQASKLAWLGADGNPLPAALSPWSRALQTGRTATNETIHLRDADARQRFYDH